MTRYIELNDLIVVAHSSNETHLSLRIIGPHDRAHSEVMTVGPAWTIKEFVHELSVFITEIEEKAK